MRAGETTRFVFRPAGPLWERRFLERAARTLSAGRVGSGLLVERRSDGPGCVVVAADPASADAVRSAAVAGAGRLDEVPDLPPPSLGAPARYLAFAPALREEPAPGGESDVIDGPTDGTPQRAETRRWVVQLHLRPVGVPGRLRISLRAGISADAPRLPAEEARLVDGVADALRRVGGGPVTIWEFPAWAVRREFRCGALRRFRAPGTWCPTPELVGGLAGLGPPAVRDLPPTGRHSVLFGSSGAGKTALLAHWAAEGIRAGRAALILDLHGDLGPAVASRLAPEDLDRLRTLEAGGAGSPGIDVFRGLDPELLAPHLVATFRRASGDGGERYWGFRLERIFDEFVRLTLEQEGNLRDLYDLLTDERRREAARLSTPRPEAARFLDELRGLLRRNPEFLWPAAARISKIALSEPLLELLAPLGAELPADRLLAEGVSVVLRLPIGRLGPEAAHLASTLLLARIYLGRCARELDDAAPMEMVVDEAQAIAPELLAEVLAEGRKFGITVRLATQFPGQLDGKLRDAAAGAAAHHLVLRTAPAGVDAVAPWVGLRPDRARELLPALTDGAHLEVRESEGRPTLRPPRSPLDGPAGRTGPPPRSPRGDRPPTTLPPRRPRSEELRSALTTIRREELTGRPGPSGSRATSSAAELTARGWLEPGPTGPRTTVAGRLWLGEGGPTGAVSESDEHRALLVEAFRIFARRGERLEIVRQGRFDTTLPDARWCCLEPSERALPAPDLAGRLRARRGGWAYRAFGGRDVFVEAEVSGADRRERIRRDLRKARAAGAHCLVLVGDPRRAARVRGVVRALGAAAPPATVWVLRAARRRERPDPPTPAADIVPDD